MKCLSCNQNHDGSYGSGKYCSISCANKRVWSEKTREKRTASLRKYHSTLSTDEKKIRYGKSGRKSGDTKLLQYKEVRRQTSTEDLSYQQRKIKVFEEQNEKCNGCGIKDWLNKPLSFELEHIDGNKHNNVRSNLEVLCPNCHAQTLTWRGRNNKKKLDSSNDKTPA